MRKILVIGGGTAGMAAATRARRIDPSSSITVLEASQEFSRGSCSLPYYVGHEIVDSKYLIGTSIEHLKSLDISLKLDTQVRKIDSRKRELITNGRSYSYDRLIVSSGSCLKAVPIASSVLNHPRLWTLRTIADAQRIKDLLGRKPEQRVGIIGGGYLGLEMAEVLTNSGCKVSIFHRGQTLMRLDPTCHSLIATELSLHGISIHTECEVSLVEPREQNAVVEYKSQGRRQTIAFDALLLTPGIRPKSELLAEAGARLGPWGAVIVDRRGYTSLDGILAAGDAIEQPGNHSGSSRYVPLASSAARLGRVCGENAAGGSSLYSPSTACISARIFGLQASTVGHPDDWENAVPYRVSFGSESPAFRRRGRGQAVFLVDPRTERLLGAQFVAPEASALADLASLALRQELMIRELEDLDFSYTPPLSSLWHPFYLAARSYHHTKTENTNEFNRSY